MHLLSRLNLLLDLVLQAYAYADFHYVHAYEISIESTTQSPEHQEMIVAQGNQHV